MTTICTEPPTQTIRWKQTSDPDEPPIFYWKFNFGKLPSQTLPNFTLSLPKNALGITYDSETEIYTTQINYEIYPFLAENFNIPLYLTLNAIDTAGLSSDPSNQIAFQCPEPSMLLPALLCLILLTKRHRIGLHRKLSIPHGKHILPRTISSLGRTFPNLLRS